MSRPESRFATEKGSHPCAESVAGHIMKGRRRVLLVGEPGVGKSTLAAGVAETLALKGVPCGCLSVDPGSPAFGAPGAVSYGEWDGANWRARASEALCSLDAARFRLPLVLALGRLLPLCVAEPLIVDGPGLIRGMAAAELLSALLELVRPNVVVVIARDGKRLPLAGELGGFGGFVLTLDAHPGARRPGKQARGKRRTALWEAYLAHARAYRFSWGGAAFTGAPPPEGDAAWTGRQVAFLDAEGHTLCLGEVVSVDAGGLTVRAPKCGGVISGMLARDACRGPEGLLVSSGGGTPKGLGYASAPEMAPAPKAMEPSGPRPLVWIDSAIATLANGVFGDPLLHLRLREQKRSLLFDLGDGSRLSARLAHQVSDVFVTHCHVDHIGGFLWLLRSRIGTSTPCRFFGPPGLTDNLWGFICGILWDRIGDNGPRFDIAELHNDYLMLSRLQPGRSAPLDLGKRRVRKGVILQDSSFSVRAVTLDHGTPVLAYAFEPATRLNVRVDQLNLQSLAPGPWIGELKSRLLRGDRLSLMTLPDGRSSTVGELAEALIEATPGKSLAYATDLADTPGNRKALAGLARDAYIFFCESAFVEADSTLAAASQHLTARACGEIATAAGVRYLMPFHFSRRYENRLQSVYAEVQRACRQTLVPGLAWDDRA